MQVTRISVEWIKSVPFDDESQSNDYDHATWSFKLFKEDERAAAVNFAKAKAKRNKFGQVWVRTEHAPRADSPEHEWEQDHDALEIVEAEAA